MLDFLLDALIGLIGAGFRGRRTPVGPYRRPTETQTEPTLLAYRAWALRRKLQRTDRRGHVFDGDVAGAELRFTTGLAGSAPVAPEFLVHVTLPVEKPVLVRREDESEGLAATLLGASPEIQSVALTSKSLRVTFEKLATPDALDATLDVLTELLRNMRGEVASYRD